VSIFTRKHYVAVAAILKEVWVVEELRMRHDSTDTWFRTVQEFSQQFKVDNPNFNVTRFQAACGINAPQGDDRSQYDSGAMNDTRFGGTLDETGE
jgi:hypothetical protein